MKGRDLRSMKSESTKVRNVMRKRLVLGQVMVARELNTILTPEERMKLVDLLNQPPGSHITINNGTTVASLK